MAITKVTRTLLSTGIDDQSNATAITIDSSENVGIKEGSPSATLHTNSGTGNIGIHQESTDSGSYISFSDNSTTSISHVLLGAVANDLVFNAGDAERMRIDSSGKLQLGTTSSSQTVFQFLSATNGANTIHFGDGASADAYRGYINYNHTGDRMEFATSGTERMRIDSSGNVGIGTTSPARALEVHSSSSPILESVASSTNNSSLRLRGSLSATHYWDVQHVHSDNDLSFGWAGSERVRITDTGNVGIGVTNPASGLVVSKSTSAGRGGEISIINLATSAVGNEAALNFGLEPSTYNADNGNAQIKARINNASTSATDIMFSTWSGSGFGERMRIDSAGSVLMYAMPSGSASSDVNINLSTNKLFYVSSSQRYKTNITDLSTSTTDILSLRPVNYDRVSEELTGEVGLIAEEVYEIIPHLVNLADVDGFDTPQPESVKYSQLSVYLLKAIQEQQTIIDDLKTRIETLESA